MRHATTESRSRGGRPIGSKFRRADFVFGRVMRGALVFNQFKGTGRLINVDDEISTDFRADELRDLKF